MNYQILGFKEEDFYLTEKRAQIKRTLDDYLEEAYIMFQLYPLSFKLKEQLRSARKIYSIDIGFIKTITSSFSDNQGRLMENIVFLELKIDGKEIYYYVDSVGGEIDFLIKQKTSVEQLIQVCFSLNDPETKKRETKVLIRAGEELKCSNLLIITWDEEGEEKFDKKTVKTVPLWKWLLK